MRKASSRLRSERARRGGRDATVERLRALFRDHPVWRAAAARLDDAATSRVTFSHRPGEEWRLVRRDGRTLLERRRAPDPDLALHFTPGAVERVTAVDGDLADFAIELFSAALDADEARSLSIEVVAPFARLVRRGYVRLLLAGGARLLAFGARHGVRSVGQLRDRVSRLTRV